MQESTSREKVLKKVRKALIHKSKEDPVDVDFETSIYAVPDEPLEILFAHRFSALNGKFVFCENQNDFCESVKAVIIENSFDHVYCLEPAIQEMLKQADVPFSSRPEDLPATNVGLTFCEFLVARTGSVMVSSKQISGRRLPVYSNYHMVVAYTSQLVLNIKDALKGMKARYGDQLPSLVSNITGPSRTADIEKTLVQGAHGPKEIFVFLIDDGPSV